jgi:hypothetical protein
VYGFRCTIGFSSNNFWIQMCGSSFLIQISLLQISFLRSTGSNIEKRSSGSFIKKFPNYSQICLDFLLDI